MQFPKSNADIPFFNCSSGFILSEEITAARKLDPLITLDELTYEVIFPSILFLYSFAVISGHFPSSIQS